jgi:amino acid adenylation domain-containing protein
MSDRTLSRLSDAQLGIWFAQALDRDKSLFNIGEALEIQGPVEPALFDAALRHAVSTAPALRLQFVETDEGPRQYVADDLKWAMQLVDVRAAADSDAAAEVWMQRAMARVVDLTRDPLFEYGLLRVAADRHIWYSRYHHLCTDGFGISLIARRVAAAYSALVADRLPETPAVTSCFELVEAERSYEASPECARDRAYWRQQLAGRGERETLCGRAPTWSDGFVRRSDVLPRSIAERLRVLGTSHRASLPQVFTAATALYVHRLTGATDLTLGMPASCRVTAEMQRTVGMVSNVLPLRLTVDRNQGIDTVLRHTSRRMLEALLHQRYRAEYLRRDLGLSPYEPEVFGPVINICAFNYNFDFAGYPVRARNIGHWRVDDVQIVVYDRLDGADIGMEFCANSDLYTPERLGGHQQRFLAFLEDLAEAKPTLPVHRVDILAPEERQTVIDDFNATGHLLSGGTLSERFEVQAARNPDGLAVMCGEDRLSYGELNERANRLAHYLIGMGVGPDSLVGVTLERSIETVISLLATLKAGGAYLPLDPGYPGARLSQMLRAAGPAVVVSRSALRARLPETTPVVLLDAQATEALLAGCASRNPTDADRVRPLRPEHAAYVIYTSGSTGTPKGVVQTQATLLNLMAWQDPGGPGGRVAQFSSMSFDVSLQEMCYALLSGKALAIVDSETRVQPEQLAAFIDENDITDLFVPNVVLEPLIKAALEDGGMAALRNIYQAGEALTITPALKRFFETHPDCRLHNHYGPTETHVVTAEVLPPGPEVWPYLPAIGSPIWNTRAYVLGGELEPVPIGVTGQLYLAGAGLARGYLGQPGLTAERFVADPYAHEPGARMYRTGDLVRWREDGSLEFLGRADQQVKIRGFRIEPGEIEALLTTHETVAQAVVMAREDAVGGRRLVAYVVPVAGKAPEVAALRRDLRSKVPEYMVPAAIIVLDALPLTSNRKLDRHALPVPNREGEEEYRAPRTPEEEILCQVFAEVLALTRVGVDDNFFDLGGHSLLAADMFSRIRRVFGKNLPISTVFQAPTVRQLAVVLQEEKRNGSWASLRAIKADGTNPPLFLVPGVGGNVVGFYELARLLGADQPVYGLQARGLDGIEKPLTRLRDIATFFVREVRSIQPLGPYYLGGACMGGVIAYEMAQQLLAIGEQVALLTLIETWPPAAHRALIIPIYFPPFLNVLVFVANRIRNHLRSLLNVNPAKWYDYLRRRWSLVKEIVREQDLYRGDTATKSSDLVTRSNYWAMFKYFPRAYAGGLVLVLASKRRIAARRDARLDWRKLAQKECRVYQVGASDSGGMLMTPYVAHLAEQLKHELERARAQ